MEYSENRMAIEAQLKNRYHILPFSYNGENKCDSTSIFQKTHKEDPLGNVTSMLAVFAKAFHYSIHWLKNLAVKKGVFLLYCEKNDLVLRRKNAN